MRIRESLIGKDSVVSESGRDYATCWYDTGTTQRLKFKNESGWLTL